MNQRYVLTETLPNGFSFDLLKIEGGIFTMGNDESAYGDEKPAHLVTVPDFFLCKYPVTQGLWEAVMGTKNNPSYFKGLNRPVEQVSWDEVQVFLEKLNAITSKRYRLPSEAEWEFAARGGKYSKGCIYAGSNKLKEVGWYNQNSHGKTKPVGMKFPNEMGLYDMSGNVEEWCADVWHEHYDHAPANGSAWLQGGDQARRVVRGGSWYDVDYYCRVSDRNRYDTDNHSLDVGFRLAR